jgi:probable F420-dependent oxidoreductase
MEIGVRIPHTGAQASPGFVREWCVVAERAGYGSLWGVDHVVMPRRVDSKYPLGRVPAALDDDAVSDLLSPNFELMTTLAFVAAVTERIGIVTAVAVLSIRNAVLNARQLATIDRYAGGRLVFGVGVGWLEEEARAMQMPWDRRGLRAEEHIALLRAIWTASGKHVEFHGEFWDVPAMDPEPKPVQQPIPILIGGHSDAAIERAARIGDGWIAGNMSPERLASFLPRLRAAAERNERDPASLLIYCSAGRSEIGLDECRSYDELGVHCLQIGVTRLDDLERFAERVLLDLHRA